MLSLKSSIFREQARLQGTGALSHYILQQREQNKPRQKLPEALNIFPFRTFRLFKRIALKFLELLFRDQRHMNALFVGAFDQVLNLQGLLSKTVQKNFEDLNASHQKMLERVTQLEAFHRSSEITLRNELVQLRSQILRNDHSGSKSAPGPLPSLTDSSQLDTFFLKFDEAFRGSMDEVTQRLEVYLPILTSRQPLSADTPVLDIGCGRGEWLELLKKNGITAKGIELNQHLAEMCCKKGLDVSADDALTTLKRLASQSLGGVTAFHVIEHLPFPILVEWVDEIKRVLKPGGFVIFETPNPKNYYVSTHNFYLDPTHIKPVPSAFSKFLLEARGFHDVEVKELHPLPEAMLLKNGEIATRLNELLYGPQDYALIGYRPL